MSLRGGYLAGECYFNVADVGGLGCEFFVLLGALGVLMYGSWSVFGDLMSPVDSFSSVGSKAARWRLRLLACVVCVWWMKELFVVRWVCWRPWCIS